jgi:serpin B
MRRKESMKTKWINSLLVLAILFVSGCAGAPTPSPATPTQPETTAPEPVPTQPPGETNEIIFVSSGKPRDAAPAVPQADLEELVAGNNQFAMDLYHSVRTGEGNLFYSPYSISLALAMTYAGARGNTAQEMAEALNFNLPAERLHPAFNKLDLALQSLGEDIPEDEEGRGFTLNIVNSIWGQEGYPFLPEFLDILAENYAAGLNLMDFATQPEISRQIINDWVMEQTNDRIEDLIPPGVIDALTRLVLVNAIYFNAGWASPFMEDFTQEGDFRLPDGSTVQAPMMNQINMHGYSSGPGFQAVELPYYGYKTSMVILHPDLGDFDSFESSLDADRLNEILSGLNVTNINLSMPKFEFEMSLPVANALQELGMVDAFQEFQADFSGMDGTQDLYIQDVLHKAFVAVDEEGTEAAAATAVVVGVTSAPLDPVEVKIDSPFIFLIRDRESGSILFVGRVLNPGS